MPPFLPLIIILNPIIRADRGVYDFRNFEQV